MKDEPKHPDYAAIFTRLLSELDLSPAGLASSIEPKTKQQTIQTYTSGKSKPGSQMLAAIIKRYPALNPVWLLTGEGEPFPNGKHGKREPFFAGGEVNQFGATVMPDTDLPEIDMEELSDYQKPAEPAAPVMQSDKDFRDLLIKRIKKLEGLVAKKDEQLAAKEAESRKLLDVVREQSGSIRFLQDQVRELQLLGKGDGNQYDAPGFDATPVRPIGFHTRGNDIANAAPRAKKRACKVVAMWDALPTAVHGESEEAAA